MAGSHFTRNWVKGCTCHSCGGAHHPALCHRSRSHPRDASVGGHTTGSAPVRNADPATRAAAAETPPLTHATAGASLLTAAATASSALTTPDSKLSALPTVELWLPGRDGSGVKAVALFDSGADRSYISASLARKIRSQVIGTTTVNYMSFGGTTSPDVTKCQIWITPYTKVVSLHQQHGLKSSISCFMHIIDTRSPSWSILIFLVYFFKENLPHRDHQCSFCLKGSASFYVFTAFMYNN